MLQEAHKVVCGPSLLSNSLRVYLNNKNRLQPIIGLSSMTECVKLSGDSDAVYLCEVCVCRLRKTDVRSHIMGSLHRYNYIKVRHPHFMSEWKQSTELSKMARPLMEMAQILENREGTGDVQVLKLEAAMYEEISSRSESDVHVLVHAIKAEQAQGEPRSQSETTLARSGYLPVQSQRTVISPRMLSDQPEKAAVVIDSQKEGVVQRSNPLMGSSVKSHASASPRTYDNCPCLIHDDVTAEGQRLLGGSEGEGARQDGVPTKLIQCEPVFKVSLSLTDGPLLVKRNSFSLEPFPGSPTHSSVDASLQPVAKGLGNTHTIEYIRTVNARNEQQLPKGVEERITDRGLYIRRDQNRTDRRFLKNARFTDTKFGVAMKQDNRLHSSDPGAGDVIPDFVSVTQPVLTTGYHSGCVEEESSTSSPPMDKEQENTGNVCYSVEGQSLAEDDRTTGCLYSTAEGIADAGYFTGGRIADGGYYTGERIADDGYSTGERIADAGYSTGERRADAGYYTGERIADAGYYTGERIADAGYSTGEWIADAVYSTGERIADAGYSTGERIADAGYSTGERIADAGYSTGERIADAGYSTGERPNKRMYQVTGERSTDSQYFIADAATDCGYLRREEQTEWGYLRREEQTEWGYSRRQGPSELGYFRREGPTEQGYSCREGPSERGFSREGPSEQGYSILEGPTERGYSRREGPTERGYSRREGPTERGYSRIEGPTDRGYSRIEGPTERGHSRIEGPTERGYSRIEGPTERGYSRREGPTERGYSRREGPTERGYCRREGPTERGYSRIEGPTEWGYSRIEGPTERGYSRREGPTERGHSREKGYSRIEGPIERGYSREKRPSEKGYSRREGPTERGYSRGERREKGLSDHEVLEGEECCRDETLKICGLVVEVMMENRSCGRTSDKRKGKREKSAKEHDFQQQPSKRQRTQGFTGAHNGALGLHMVDTVELIHGIASQRVQAEQVFHRADTSSHMGAISSHVGAISSTHVQLECKRSWIFEGNRRTGDTCRAGPDGYKTHPDTEPHLLHSNHDQFRPKPIRYPHH